MSDGQGNFPSLTNEMVINLLTNTLSLSDKTREEAEAGLKSLEVAEDFGIHLAEILVGSDIDLAVRYSAFTTFQSYAEIHWRNLFNEEFELPEINLESKRKIKELLLRGLRDPTGEIRRAVAQIISAIAQWDWPQDWPGLYDVLIDCFSRESDFAVHEAMEVLTVCIRYITYIQLPSISPVILQAMYQIFQDENQYSILIRSQAAETFTTIIGFLAIPGYCETDFIRHSIQPVIPMFCEKFMQTLHEKDDSTSNGFLKTTVINAINMLTATLPKCISNLLPQMLSLIWEILADIAKTYREYPDDKETDTEEEVGMNGCNTLLNAIFDFISVLLDGKRGRVLNFSEYDLSQSQWLYLQDNLLPDTIQHLMTFMELTGDHLVLWTDNLSRFLIEGETDIHTNNIRSLTRNLFIKIVDHPERAAANTLVLVILKRIQTENARRLSTDSRVTETSWLSHEAALLAFCIAKNIIVEKQKANIHDFDIIDFLENVALADLNSRVSHPLLVCRVLHLGGIYADLMPLEMIPHFLKATTAAYKDQSACTKIGAAMATHCWLRAASINRNNGIENILKDHLPAIFQGLFDLGNCLMSAEGSKLVLESFAILISLEKTFTASVQNKICTLTIAALLNFNNVLSILYVCEKIFRELTLHPQCREPLQTRLVPKLVEMMNPNPSDKPANGKVAFDVLQILVEHSLQPLNGLLIESAFPALCDCILSSDDHLTLQSGAKVMRSFISVALQQVVSYKDSTNKTGVQYILQVAAKLLEPQCSDHRIEDACEMAISLLKTTGNALQENIYMQQLLVAMLYKVKYSGKIFARRLLIVFAHLINMQFDVALDFLSNESASTEWNRLAIIVFKGFCNEHEFFEQDDRKIVNLALSKLLKHDVMQHDTRRCETAVQDGEVRTTIPLLIEICKLISNEL